MKIIRSFARMLVLALTVLTAAAHANVLLDVSGSLSAGDPTQLGRLSRNGILQDWAGTETYPGAINLATVYHYHTYTIPVGAARYVQVMFDSASANTFVSAYLSSYAPANLATNWVGDAGGSGNFFGTDPRYFNVLVPASSTLVVVVNETAAGGVGAPFRLIVEGYVDVNYTSTVASATTLSSSLNPSTTGASVTFTAQVTGVVPTGTVDFQDGGISIAGCGARPVAGGGNSRTATCTTNALGAGSHPVVAYYGGDLANAASSSSTVNQVVNVLGGTLGCAPNPAQELVNVSCTLTVSGNSPTGTVRFLDGAATIPGCGGVLLTGAGNTRTATCSTTALGVGSHDITTVYSGDKSNPGGPSSNAVTETITARPASSTAVTSSLNPSNYGQPVTFTATVTGASPTGTVQFKDGATTIIAGCTARPMAGGVATCLAPTLSPGTHNVTGIYSGDLGNAPSTSPVMPQVVNCSGKGCPAT